MNYTLRQLQVFKSVGTLLSFTKAAEQLHLTQPAVSIQFKTFAQQFDFPLIEYQGKNLVLTELGKEVFQHVTRILDQTTALDLMNKSVKNKLYGTLTLSVVSTGKYIMPFLINEFIKQHPEVDLVMDVTNKTKVIESLENNTVDFALVSTLPKKLKVDQLELMPNDLYLVGNHEHAASLDKRALEEQTFLFRESGSATRGVMEKFLRGQNITPYKKVELTSNEAVKQSVVAGLGISVMPMIGMKRELDQGLLHIIEHDNLPITTRWRVLWRSNKEMSPVAIAFLEHLEQHHERLQRELFSS
jgi:DNA-binding transcriptional LysR family regulator